MTGFKNKVLSNSRGLLCLLLPALLLCTCAQVSENCGDGAPPLNSRTHFCFGGAPVEKCGGNTYDPSAEFCHNKTAVYPKCNGEDILPGSCGSIATYTLSTTATPTAGGTVSRNPNQDNYNTGTQVIVTATAAQGYNFTGWTGASTSTSNSVTITMDGNKTLTATFQSTTSGGSIVYDTLIDTRDNDKRYRTVKIGNQTWMAENLNYKTTSGSWCYGDADSNCTKYGRLYDWNAAMSACPAGWHLPASADWDNLVQVAGSYYVAGNNLKSTSGWEGSYDGTDKLGFSALPGGNRGADGSFQDVGLNGYWWNATEGSNTRYMYSYSGSVTDFNYDKRNGFSVRCILDD